MIALLLDRDGTLMEDVGYPNDPATVRLIPGAADTVKELVSRFGCVPCIVSNQSGVARGLITQEQFQAVHERFTELFRQQTGLTLPAYYCLHGTDENCLCRKPKPGLLQQAIAELGLAGKPAVMIGDKPSDVGAGAAIGARTVWLSQGRTYPGHVPMPDLFADSWTDVLPWFEETMG
jgi:D-glycero-D-manno-heptose 1,7-bisphosphate phosphatase